VHFIRVLLSVWEYGRAGERVKGRVFSAPFRTWVKL